MSANFSPMSQYALDNPGASLLLITLPLLVLSEHKSRSHIGTGLFKILSSVAFLSHPLLLPSVEWTPYRYLITTGLLFSLAGDFFLIPSRDEFYNLPSTKSSQHNSHAKGEAQGSDISLSFQLGVVAFAIAHVAYTVAFFKNSAEVSWIIFATTFVATVGIAKWLGVIYPPSQFSTIGNVLDLVIESEMKPLVTVYAVIISSMFSAAASTIPLDSSLNALYQRVLGAGMFVLSDVFVAKDAFGRGSVRRNRGWIWITVGYGLYFGGSLLSLLRWTLNVISWRVERGMAESGSGVHGMMNITL
ncbi:YhhN domain-containing protein [Aspergillus sclerotialis]|uniref:YhhN domain-containing protein n=1 Tax=Aspergillus sclerotialis TaxID=2070753 RepID=A0A3A2ZFF9_9EURO|nr:YhhN domain-containing protein [Aspergillus sclerotialis]